MTAKQAAKLLKKMDKADALIERADEIYSEIRSAVEAIAQEAPAQ